MNKIKDKDSVFNKIESGDMIAFGGNLLHRAPIQAAYEIAKTGVKNLHLIKTVLAMEADILALAGSLGKVSAGFVGYEAKFGLCQNYRNGVETGEIIADEHACYSVITALRAASYNVPFLPIRGYDNSDLVDTIGLKTVKDPYSHEELLAVKAMRPDWGIIHVQFADRFGNGKIIGANYEDDLICRASENVILTCEKIVDDDFFDEHKADISQVFVDYVVEVPKGASPGFCPGFYNMDDEEITKFKDLKSLE